MSTDDVRPEPVVEVGRIGRAHGVRGQVHVHLVTDRDERVAPGSQLRAGDRWLTVVESRPQRDGWVVRFEGVEDRTAAEALAGTLLFATPLPESPGDLWVHQLIGSRVVDVDGVDHGTCTAVLDNPAHELMELGSGALVPVTFVVECRDGVTTIDPPEGLFDL